MGLEIKILDLGDIELESSFLVLARNCGIRTKVPCFSYLILGGEAPVLVDTGFRHPAVMQALGMGADIVGEQGFDRQLAQHGLKRDDIKYIAHSHLHIDHAGQDDLFPLSTVIVNRRELEYGASGLMGEQYPAEDMKHLIDRLHQPGKLRLLDLEDSGPDEIIPGVVAERAGAHTEGSMNILVQTDEGVATICGDVIYDVQNQVLEPFLQVMDMDSAVTGNHGTSKRSEKAGIRKVLNSGRFILPLHDRPALVEGTSVVGRLLESVPGPVVKNEAFPGALTEQIQA